MRKQSNYIIKYEPWPTVVSPVSLFHKHTAIPILLRAWQVAAVILEPLVVWTVPSYDTTWLLHSTFFGCKTKFLKLVLKTKIRMNMRALDKSKLHNAYKAQRGWLGLFYVVSWFVSWFLPQLISPPNGENTIFQMLFVNQSTTTISLMIIYEWLWEGNTWVLHLADIEGVMVEAFDKEQNSRWWKLVVISQQQRQEANCNLFELPRPGMLNKVGVKGSNK